MPDFTSGSIPGCYWYTTGISSSHTRLVCTSIPVCTHSSTVYIAGGCTYRSNTGQGRHSRERLRVFRERMSSLGSRRSVSSRARNSRSSKGFLGWAGSIFYVPFWPQECREEPVDRSRSFGLYSDWSGAGMRYLWSVLSAKVVFWEFSLFCTGHVQLQRHLWDQYFGAVDHRVWAERLADFFCLLASCLLLWFCRWNWWM